MKSISLQDINHLKLIRKNVDSFLDRVSHQYADGSGLLLDVAPQDHKGARPFFGAEIQIETLDIDLKSGATYIADLCNCVDVVGVDRFEFIVCTEVLEHTRQPFSAVDCLFKILKPGGYLFVTTPFNFRIHGPLPDCWRFTEHGLRELFNLFEIVELEGLECEDRFLMPIQYTLIARKPISKN